MWLSRSCEDGAPGRAVRIEPLLLRRQEFNRYVNEPIVQGPDHQIGFAGHSGMGSMPRELIAKNRVFGSVWAASHDVARVKVTHDEGNVSSVKPLFDPLLQKQADVTEPDVP